METSALALVAITDDLRDGRSGLVHRAAAAVRGGATMIQLRLKDVEPRMLVEVGRALVDAVPVPVIINDRVDVALACGAAGAHLGLDDLPITAARGLVPHGFILGASLGDDEELLNARGADYVGIGPVFNTLSKSDAGDAIGTAELGRLARLAARPAVAIGGVSAENAAACVRVGAMGVAVIRAVFAAPDPETAARAIRDAMASESASA